MADGRRPAARGRTFWGIAGDLFFFGVGAGFAGQTTVIPSFLATLTQSAPLIGMASTIVTGGWLVPQLFAANRLAGRRRRKASVAIPGTVGRTVALLMGPAMLLLVPRSLSTALAVFLLLYLVLWVTDGIASIAWLDIMGRCLTAPARARLISFGTVAQGIAGIGAGALVGVVLSSSALPWPRNYALLFILSGIGITLSLVSFMFIKEEPEAVTVKPLPWPDYFRRLASVVKSDPDFRRAIATQLALGGVGIAAPYYIVNGLERLGFPPSSIGFFTSVQLVGGVFSTLLLGLLGERRGTRAVMRVWGCLAMVPPVLALAGPGLGSLFPAATLYLYALIFMVVGVQGNANMAGFLNWVLEYAPASDRPMYIGFANTLTGMTLIMPLLGGWILAASGSYPALFAVSAIGPVISLFLLRKLPEPRRSGPGSSPTPTA
jgi:MFS family permease